MNFKFCETRVDEMFNMIYFRFELFTYKINLLFYFSQNETDINFSWFFRA